MNHAGLTWVTSIPVRWIHAFITYSVKPRCIAAPAIHSHFAAPAWRSRRTIESSTSPMEIVGKKLSRTGCRSSFSTSAGWLASLAV